MHPAKALECFMESLILEACYYAKMAGSKKLSLSHLKLAIISSKKFDFLKDFVDAVPDVPKVELMLKERKV